MTDITSGLLKVRAINTSAQRRIMRRKFFDALLMAAAYAGAGAILLFVLVLIWQLFSHAWPAMYHFGLKFFTTSEWDPTTSIYGALPAIGGTLLSALLALLIATPIAIGSALFLVTIAPRWGNGRGKWIVAPASFLIELLAAIPSIAYGLWGIAVLVPIVQRTIIPPLANTLGQWNWKLISTDDFGNETYFPANLFSGASSGYGLITASIILAVMILPIITAVTRDVLRVAPKELEQGAYGAGATWWQATRIVLTHCKAGIFGAVILGMARALGETMAVTMVMPPPSQFSVSVIGSWPTITTMLANRFREVPAGLHADSLVYLALILLVMTMAINLVARRLVSRTAKR